MATKFLNSGGDEDFAVTTGTGFWSAISGAVSIATDFVHGNHVKSIKFATSNSQNVTAPAGTLADAGSRISFYLYLTSIPTNANEAIFRLLNSAGNGIAVLTITQTTGVLKMRDQATAGTQIGSNGPALSAGQWYRISLAYTISSTTVNRFELFVDAVSAISITNATLTATGTNKLNIGKTDGADESQRVSDIYIDDSAALTDPGNIWVTAKRPNANGTANNFGVQIGSGGSSYGSGHSPQVNERALSTTNGWSVVAVAATTEEYNIEAKGTGDIDISTATIVDYVGWVVASSVTNETASIIVNNVSSNISLTNTATMFTKVAGSAIYPAGTGTDIGVITDATATTVGLYEAGIIVAYIPASFPGQGKIGPFPTHFNG